MAIMIIVIETHEDLKPGEVEDLRECIGDFLDEHEVLSDFNLIQNTF